MGGKKEMDWDGKEPQPLTVLFTTLAFLFFLSLYKKLFLDNMYQLSFSFSWQHRSKCLPKLYLSLSQHIAAFASQTIMPYFLSPYAMPCLSVVPECS